MVPRMQNPPIYSYTGKSADALFNGLLAELPAILDRFFTSTTSHY